MNRLDSFVAILDVLKELPDEDAAKLISLLYTLSGPSLRFLLRGDPGPSDAEET